MGGTTRIDNTGSQLPMFSKQLDTVGDGSGTKNMAVLGTLGTPVIYRLKPPAGEIWKIARLILYIRDAGAFDSGGWGNNLGSPLTNGIQVVSYENAQEFHWLYPPVKSHGDIASVCHDLTYQDFGSGDAFITARWSFTKFGQYLRLHGDEGDELRILVQDDLTHLVEQAVTAQGFYERGYPSPV